jgi:sodium transport system permease protein
MLTIALKELTEALRDTRSLVSSAFYCLMGPLVVGMVSLALKGKGGAVLPAMISIFALVSVFSGGMNVAMDVLAGERERKSLVPLLANSVSRSEIILGKWIAVAAFCLAGAVICVLGFTIVHAPAGLASFSVILFTGLLPLSFLAAALEVSLSALCRSLKEAHTYLSMLVFVPMLVGMFDVFFAQGSVRWHSMLPIAGHQLQLEDWFAHRPVPFLPAFVAGMVTMALAAAVLLATAALFERDDAVYGR